MDGDIITDISSVKEKIWDYSTLSSFQTCRKKYYFEHIRHLKPRLKGAALQFGGAIHTALDEYYTSKDMNKAKELFSKEWQDREGDEIRTVENGIKLLTWYERKYQ